MLRQCLLVSSSSMCVQPCNCHNISSVVCNDVSQIGALFNKLKENNYKNYAVIVRSSCVLLEESAILTCRQPQVVVLLLVNEALDKMLGPRKLYWSVWVCVGFFLWKPRYSLFVTYVTK